MDLKHIASVLLDPAFCIALEPSLCRARRVRLDNFKALLKNSSCSLEL